MTITVKNASGVVIFEGEPSGQHDYVDLHQREGQPTTMTCCVTALSAGMRAVSRG